MPEYTPCHRTTGVTAGATTGAATGDATAAPTGDATRAATRRAARRSLDPFRWIIENPGTVDLIVFGSAALLIPFFALVAGAPGWWILFTVPMVAAGAVCRTHPRLGVTIIAATAIIHFLLGMPVVLGDAMTFYALYCGAAHGSRVLHIASVVLGFVGVLFQSGYWALGAFIVDGGSLAAAAAALIGLTITGSITIIAIWALARLQHARLTQITLVRDRAEQAEREREQRAEIAVAAERTRIAREMHDVVAHSLSVIIAQADGGRFIAAQKPELAADVLTTIADTGRTALADMRSLLGVLRSDEETSYGPQPGPDMLPDLVERVRAAGVPIDLEISGDLDGIPSALGLTLFRLVQESLTNVMKHAGPGAAAEVRITRDPDRLRISVIDDGQGTDPASDGQGHGLTGMRERVSAFGGTLRAGPLPGRGFRVLIEVPLNAPEPNDPPPPHVEGTVR